MRHLLAVTRGIGFVAFAVWLFAPTVSALEDDAFAGAEACKKCHGATFDAWSHTKHAHAINRLQHSERKQECINCHITDTPEMLAAANGQPEHPNVQCEACHGAAAAHAANPAIREGLVARPAAASCERCHNEKSPHFRGFVYDAMRRFVHAQ
jgi:hypothetical protein